MNCLLYMVVHIPLSPSPFTYPTRITFDVNVSHPILWPTYWTRPTSSHIFVNMFLLLSNSSFYLPKPHRFWMPSDALGRHPHHFTNPNRKQLRLLSLNVSLWNWISTCYNGVPLSSFGAETASFSHRHHFHLMSPLHHNHLRQ